MKDERLGITGTPGWGALEAHRRIWAHTTLRDLFREDPDRAERMTLEAGDLTLDHSKDLVTNQTMHQLVLLAERAGLRERIDAMFRGERVNVTEDRPALHVALRAPRGATILVDGHDVVPDVHAVLERMGGFADAIRSGAWRGATDRPIRAVVNVGIGGSDLGPAMAYEALRDFSDRSMTFRFASNVDAADIWEATIRARSSHRVIAVRPSSSRIYILWNSSRSDARRWTSSRRCGRGSARGPWPTR